MRPRREHIPAKTHVTRLTKLPPDNSPRILYPIRAMVIAVRYLVRPMRLEDIPQVMEIERESFPTMWPPTAFRRELQQNRLAHYIVVVEDNPRVPRSTETAGAHRPHRPLHRRDQADAHRRRRSAPAAARPATRARRRVHRHLDDGRRSAHRHDRHARARTAGAASARRCSSRRSRPRRQRRSRW